MVRIKIIGEKMKYFTNKNKELFGFGLDGSQDHLITEDMSPISIEEIHKINQDKEDKFRQTLEYKLIEAKLYLSSTDHKEFPRYKPKEGENLSEIFAKRDEYVAFIRENK